MMAMKTYKPKKPVYSEIEDVQGLCRLCLEKAVDGVMIYKNKQDVCAAVAMRVMICVGLEIKQEQSLPNTICKSCYEELEKYYKFRKKCQLSDQKLKSHLLTLKLKEQNENEVPIKNVTENDVQEETVLKPIENNVQMQLSQTEQLSEVVKSDTAKDVTVEQGQESNEESNPTINSFLTSILTELGILSQQHSLLQHQGVSNFQLETGDEEQFLLELVEEDDQAESIGEEQPAQASVELDDTAVKPEPTHTRRGKSARAWCGACARSFSSRSALARHARGHAGARAHACPVCRAGFEQKAVLQRHMLVHLDVRPHRCSECDKSFTQRAALAAHARSHAAPHARSLALHRCSACDKLFLYASGLSRHMMSHNGRTYSCSACDKHFKDKSSLLRHLRTVCRKRAAVVADAASGSTGAVLDVQH